MAEFPEKVLGSWKWECDCGDPISVIHCKARLSGRDVLEVWHKNRPTARVVVAETSRAKRMAEVLMDITNDRFDRWTAFMGHGCRWGGDDGA